MLAELIQQNQITAEATTTTPRRRRHPVLPPTDQLQHLGMSERDLLDQIVELFIALADLHRLTPRPLRVGEILRGANHLAAVAGIDVPQRQNQHGQRLPRLARNFHDNRAEPIQPIVVELEPVQQHPLLPRKQPETQPLGERDSREAMRSLGR
jgi:hypothetical protein